MTDTATKVITVTLHRVSFTGEWSVTTSDYDASCEDGETFRGSNIEFGRTMEEAIQNYREYLEGEGEEGFVLSIEGPADEIEWHNWMVKKGYTQTKQS